MRRPARLSLAIALLVALLLPGAAIGSSLRVTGAAAGVTQGSGTAAAPPLPACQYLDIKTRFRNTDQWSKTLVDTRLRVGRKYVPPDLVSVAKANIAGSGKVRRIIIADLKAMAAAARKAGRGIAVRSAYRSYTDQIATFNGWVARSGRKAALKASARPGHSEHQLGTTIDFRSASTQKAPWDYSDWATSKPGAWMQANAWKYGFIMSYPKGKMSTTCYQYEPWHYRYVGRKLAKQVHDSGLTLRAYLWRHFETRS